MYTSLQEERQALKPIAKPFNYNTTWCTGAQTDSLSISLHCVRSFYKTVDFNFNHHNVSHLFPWNLESLEELHDWSILSLFKLTEHLARSYPAQSVEVFGAHTLQAAHLWRSGYFYSQKVELCWPHVPLISFHRNERDPPAKLYPDFNCRIHVWTTSVCVKFSLTTCQMLQLKLVLLQHTKYDYISAVS